MADCRVWDSNPWPYTWFITPKQSWLSRPERKYYLIDKTVLSTLEKNTTLYTQY